MASAIKDPAYPLTVVYCGVCGVPPEYCNFGPDWERCQVWIAANCPHLMPTSSATAPSGGGGGGGGGGGSSSGGGGAGSAAAGDTAPPAGAGSAGGDDDEPAEDGSNSDSDGDDDMMPAAGSKGRRKQKKSAKPDPAKAAITVTKRERKKNKWVTSISGLESFGECLCATASGARLLTLATRSQVSSSRTAYGSWASALLPAQR